jgi:TRAP transporter 4TM/12TM fusion protein
MTDTQPLHPIKYVERREFSLLEDVLRADRLDLPSILALVASSLAIALAMYHIFVAGFGTPESLSFRSTHLSAMLLLAFLIKPTFRSALSVSVWQAGLPGNAKRCLGFAVDTGLIVLVLAVQVYLLSDIEELQAREGSPDENDLIFGWILIGLVLEATRRAVGWAMVIITAFFILQTLKADWFVGMFYGPPVGVETFIDAQFIQVIGIFGIPILVASTYIVLFIVFGAILIRSGAGRFFIDLAVSLTGHRLGGPAKAAVVASAFLGTVSGSATANVVTTGSFTIPMMKNLGYRPKFAAAVEACASSGGQITPPIMGAAAFIIAEFLRVPYVYVIVAAIIPTFLYFSTMYFMVHLEADKYGIARIPKEQLPNFREVMREGWHLMLALVLLVVLLVMGRTVTLAAFWAIIALFGLSFVNRATRMSPVDLLAALESGVRSAMPVSIACACAGIIIGCTFTSGLGLKFTNSVIDMSGGYLLSLLILTALAAIVLGMGITTTAVYITVAALIVPALIEIGVNPMAAHLFAFYFGVVSSITPPVALAAFAAAAIAGTSPMMTAVESARVGIAKYLVPFIFVYNPSLLFEGPLWLTVYSTATAFVGVWMLSVALEGWLRIALSPAVRLLAGIGALCMMYPPIVGLFGMSGFVLNAIGAALVLYFWFGLGRTDPPAAREAEIKARP